MASATRMLALTQWKDPEMLGDLAAAWSEAGDFGAAVKWQAEADALHTASKEKAAGEARLRLDPRGKPFRETRP